MYSNNTTEYTPHQILNLVSQAAYNEKLDMLLLFDNFDNDIVINENDGYYLKTSKNSYINFYNWQFPKIDTNQIGYL